jgi:hypothetical protein
LLSRERRTTTKGFDGSDIIQFDNYDNKGNLIMSTEPHKSQTTFNYSLREYNDPYNRLTSVNNGPFGVTTYLYEYDNGILNLTTSAPTGITSQKQMPVVSLLVLQITGEYSPIHITIMVD